ncbi:MAG: hypothetical protein ACR2MX_10995 [Cyclobacteriaceae bacterium]
MATSRMIAGMKKKEASSIEMISPINNDRIEKLQESLGYSMNAIATIRQQKGEEVTKGQVILEALSAACREQVSVKEGECTRVEIKNTLEEVESNLISYIAKLSMDED